ncbi:MAG: nucleotidyltransferase domain-containing protein [Candidatus Omnitrophota bacterium]
MKIHNKLDEILKHGSKIKILRFLFAEKDEHTGRSIAKGIGMSPSSTYNTLQEMKKEDLISARRKGNAILYKLRQDNYVVKKLLAPLFEKEKFIYNDIISFIKKRLLQAKTEIISIALFGSVIRKEETSRSDIDLLVLLKNSAGKLKIDTLMDKLHIDMAKRFGASISPYILTVSEIRQRYSQKKRIIKSILDNNELIYGEPVERILA